ncbi:hypothetical protein TcasGA2_TC013983 [Tribolium castaneum]|uniref:Uncharacterized protein n=1 Tax=Tribolium castaneum TaxID=7070 RepID=D6WIY5_TRICA|nr:hypothetical protein TcasGA2_TC013983 [Tribolium castaneum]
MEMRRLLFIADAFCDGVTAAARKQFDRTIEVSVWREKISNQSIYRVNLPKGAETEPKSSLVDLYEIRRRG